MDGRWLKEDLGGGYLDQTYSSWMSKVWIQKFSFNVRCVCGSSYWWCRESIVGSKNRHPGNSSWLYLKVPTHGCSSKQTIQSHLTKMMGKLHFKCCRNFPWCKPRPQFQNSNTNTATNSRLGERSLRLSNTKSGDGQALIWGLWDNSIRYRKCSKCWLLQTMYERSARKFGKWSRRRRRPFHFVDCKKIRILAENNDCVVVFNFS